jgi:ribonuclease HI
LLDLNEREKITIYTDGSVAANNNGGVGIRIISIDSNGDEVVNDSYSSGHRNANSGQMEIIACTVALEEAIRLQLTLSINRIVIFTDSKYVSENYKKAMFKWSCNQWKRSTGRPVPDAHLWIDLIKQIAKCNKDHIYVDVLWVKGHEKNKHNKAVDEMAKKASKIPLEKMPKNRPITIFQPRKFIPSPIMEMGSIEMTGQKISIKILSCKLLEPQNIWCYQYQIISNNSPFRGFVDQIFSAISLDPNKSYYVRFNINTNNPKIEKLYWEIN